MDQCRIAVWQAYKLWYPDMAEVLAIISADCPGFPLPDRLLFAIVLEYWRYQVRDGPWRK